MTGDVLGPKIKEMTKLSTVGKQREGKKVGVDTTQHRPVGKYCIGHGIIGVSLPEIKGTYSQNSKNVYLHHLISKKT